MHCVYIVFEQGARGEPGAVGSTGDEGASGETGKEGPRGDHGQDGPPVSRHLCIQSAEGGRLGPSAPTIP